MTRSGSSDRLVIGAMTGSSIDGLDLALCRVTGRQRSMQVELISASHASLGELAVPLRRVAEQVPLTAGEMAGLALRLGELHAMHMQRLLGDRLADLAVAHGQTVFHDPPVSLQLLNPAPIEHRLGCRVISDLRRADLAAGGQGAPIMPLADRVMFSAPGRARAVVNLGGFCSITFLPRDDDIDLIDGFDICVCNQVLDGVARAGLDAPFDENGRSAARGTISRTECDELHSMLTDQRQDGRSLGTGDEALSWVDRHRDRVAPDDLAATAVAAVSRCIGDAVNELDADELIVGGGGACNRTLVDQLARVCAAPLTLTADHGIPLSAREAVGMAVLGCMLADGEPITLPRVTGRAGARLSRAAT